MASQLWCTVTNTAVSVAYLRRADAERARCGSELLIVKENDWALSHAEFPRRAGLQREVVVERWWDVRCGMIVNGLIEQFHTGELPGSG